MPADGHVTYTNLGIHNVTLFTTGPSGIQCAPPLFEDLSVGEQLRECGAVQVNEGLAVNASSQTDVEAGQLVYIARADKTSTSRTIAVNFTAVPPNALGSPSPTSDAKMFVQFNATTQDAKSLAKLLRGIPVKVNLIPMNSVDDNPLKAPSWETVDAFQDALRAQGVPNFVRRRKGDDIAAALGGHAGTETVAALADELGGLIGALHLSDTAVCGPSWFCPAGYSGQGRSVVARGRRHGKAAPEASPSVGGLIAAVLPESM